MLTRFLTSFALFLLTAAVGFGETRGKLSRDLPLRGDETVDVIVRFKKTPRGAHLARRGAGIPAQLGLRGAKSKARLGLIRSEAYSVRASQLEMLANHPDVEFIAPDRKVRGTLDHATPSVGGRSVRWRGRPEGCWPLLGAPMKTSAAEFEAQAGEPKAPPAQRR